MPNNVEFVGGPKDGEVATVADLQPIAVWGYSWPDSPRVLGYYVAGRGSQRGKMLWRPTPEEPADD